MPLPRAVELSRLELIDRLIEQHGLLGRRCVPAHKRSQCRCGHTSLTHTTLKHPLAHPKDWVRGECRGRGCPCVMFVPYDYAKETQARLKKLRMFALDLLDGDERH